MKRSILLLMAIAIAVIFAGCAKEEILAPESDQLDKETTALKAKKVKTSFTGECNLTFPGYAFTETVLPNGKMKWTGESAYWFDEAVADDGGDGGLLVSGISKWTATRIFNPDGTVKLWGKCTIFVGTDPSLFDGMAPGLVDLEELDEILETASDGIWQMTWRGYQTPFFHVSNPAEDGFDVVCDVVGQGKSGLVKGKTAKWTYTLNYRGGFPLDFGHESLVYMTKGYYK